MSDHRKEGPDMKPGIRAAQIYPVLLGTVFLLAVPFSPAVGGYTRITAFKASVYCILTVLFLIPSLIDPPPLRGFFQEPARPLALIYLFFCLLSAVCSRWPETALLGGTRSEGLIQIGLYVLSFLVLSLRPVHHSFLLPSFAAGILITDAVCLLQLGGINVLGLFPPGLGWADAGVSYPGAYLGTLGNAGQTGAVLASASALFFLSLLQYGEKRLLLVPVLLLSAVVLSLMDLTAPRLAVSVIVLVSLPVYGRTPSAVCRWGVCSFPLIAIFLWRPFGIRSALLLLPAALCFYFEPRLSKTRGIRRWSALLFACLGILSAVLFLSYRGWYGPFREAGALLHGKLDNDMGSGRVYIWRQVASAVPEHLWLGTGPDTLGLLGLPPYSYYSEEAGRSITLSIDAAHCEYLHTLVCCGLPAALCHLGLAVCAMIGFFRKQDRGRICSGVAACYSVQALFGISMCSSAPVFWAFLALSLAEGGVPPAPIRQK